METKVQNNSETGKKKLIIDAKKIAAFEGRKKYDDVLNDLLKEIRLLHFREFLDLPKDVEVKQKHIIVAVIKYLLQVAKEKNWNLAKVYDYTYIYNGAFWQQCDKDIIKDFLGLDGF